MFRLAGKLFSNVMPAVIRPLRILWNEIIGFFFLVFAVWAIPSAWRSYRTFDGDLEDFMRIFLTGIFVVMMLGFGIYSFFRARKISRS